MRLIVIKLLGDSPRIIPAFIAAVFFIVFCSQVNANTMQRHALVIGNGNYQSVPSLDNPINDATAIATKLRGLNFQVTELSNANRSETLEGIAKFVKTLSGDSVALLYYAGHGVQHEGKNFLLPVDIDITESWQLQESAVNLDTAVEALKSSGAPLRIIMLDACRDNPLKDNQSVSRTLGNSRGLAEMDATFGTIISYATEPGAVAYDGEGKHSPYTEALLMYLDTPDETIPNILNKVGRYVLELTNYTQTPWWSSSPIPDFCFLGCKQTKVPSTLEQFAASFSAALESKDLLQLSSLTNRVPNTKDMFTPLFGEYSELKIRSVSGDVSNTLDTGEIELVIQEARTNEGRIVYPSAEWGQLKLKVRRNGDKWNIVDINSALPTAEEGIAVDFRSPLIVFSQNNPQLVADNQIAIEANITDDTGITSAALYYRLNGSNEPFISVPFVSAAADSSTFFGRIPNKLMQSGTQLEVFAEASDSTGNRTQYPSRDNPLIILLNNAIIGNQSGSKTNWLAIGIGALLLGALVAGSGGGGDNSDGLVTITTPLP